MGKYINEQGNRCGRLYVVCEAGRDKYGGVLWFCMCDCGNYPIVRGNNLRNGRTKSCGCLQKEDIGKRSKHTGENSRNFKHGETCQNTQSRLYKCWSNMKSRILNPNYTGYEYYGGKGIKACDEWLEFIPFMEWSLVNGYTDELTIDRIDSDGDYCPENCQWITKSENSKKSNKKKGGNKKWQNKLLNSMK